MVAVTGTEAWRRTPPWDGVVVIGRYGLEPEGSVESNGGTHRRQGIEQHLAIAEGHGSGDGSGRERPARARAARGIPHVEALQLAGTRPAEGGGDTGAAEELAIFAPGEEEFTGRWRVFGRKICDLRVEVLERQVDAELIDVFTDQLAGGVEVRVAPDRLDDHIHLPTLLKLGRPTFDAAHLEPSRARAQVRSASDGYSAEVCSARACSTPPMLPLRAE